jgi:hypothetical protein
MVSIGATANVTSASAGFIPAFLESDNLKPTGKKTK